MEEEVVTDEAFQHVDLYGCSFIDGEFLANGLNEENALDYFKRSPFYTDNPAFSYEPIFPGQIADFFKIIKKWTHRESEDESKEEVVAVYYVVRGNIFQCPDLYSLLKYRMYNCINLLNQSYTELRKFVSFSPSYGHVITNYPIPTEEENKTKAIDNPVCNVIPILGSARVQHVVEKNKDCLNKMISDMENLYRNDMTVENQPTETTASV